MFFDVLFYFKDIVYIRANCYHCQHCALIDRSEETSSPHEKKTDKKRIKAKTNLLMRTAKIESFPIYFMLQR